MKIVISIAALLICSCSSGERTTSVRSTTRPVKSVIAAPSNYIEREFAALSTPVDAVNLAFKVSGQVISIPLATGELVSGGEVVAQMDRREFELQLSADRANYEQSRSRLERAERLLQHEAISQQEVESAESEFKRAEAAYENAKENLLETSLRAPYNAIVELTYVDVFQRVQAGERIIRIVTPTSNQVSFTLPESSLNAIRDPKTEFNVHFDNIPNVEFMASIKEYAQTSSDASGFPVTLQFENSDESRYRISPGMSCIVTMITPQSDNDTVMVPLSSIYAPTSGGTFVWVIGSDGRVSMRSVNIEAPVGRSSVVISGALTSGERVVTAGIYQLREGQRVKVIQQ